MAKEYITIHGMTNTQQLPLGRLELSEHELLPVDVVQKGSR